MDPIAELPLPHVETLADARQTLIELTDRINQLVRVVNELIAFAEPLD